MSVQRADVWKVFQIEFSKLATEEADIVRARLKDDYLVASCDYERGTEILHNRLHPDWGRYCLLRMPECGIWNLSSGVNENFQERFRTLAARAGVALGCPEGTEHEDFWLHSLFQYLLENGSKLLFAAKKDEGGMIQRVCEASATFCARLERKALERPATITKEELATLLNRNERKKYGEFEDLSEDGVTALAHLGRTETPDRQRDKSTGQQSKGGTEEGRLALGETVNTLYEELKRLKEFARGRRKTEDSLRTQFSNFQLWKEIDESSSLPRLKRMDFFQKTLDSHGQPQLMDFIGNIVGYEGGTAYKIWKEYRNHAGLKRKRRSSKRLSKTAPNSRPKQRPK